MSEPHAVVAALVVDCAEPAVVAEFWHGLLGGELVPFDDYDVVALRSPGITFDFVGVPDQKVVKNRLHLDVATEDPQATIDRALELGATMAPDIHESPRFTIMRDVEGNEFCVMNYAIDGPFVPPASPEG